MTAIERAAKRVEKTRKEYEAATEAYLAALKPTEAEHAIAVEGAVSYFEDFTADDSLQYNEILADIIVEGRS